jgi:glycosyltransferase involved in cell wall biosynthesis
MSSVDRLYFVHEGKAAYPEIAAYRRFFADRFATAEIHPRDAAREAGLATGVAWCLMGFYPDRFGAARVVHDYRSLSIGRLARVKDAVKRWRNARPDVRIFQNATLREKMDFRDDVPSVLLPMGVPANILAARAMPGDVHDQADFVYAGVLSAERRLPTMIDSFVRRFQGRRTLALYGPAEPRLVARYAATPGVRFLGVVPQETLFARLRACRAAVAFFPNHAPHLYQTPTKLLEYAALGGRIIANEQPASRQAASRFGITCWWGPADDLFAACPESLAWDDNATLEASSFLWPAVIAASGIAERIAAWG